MNKIVVGYDGGEQARDALHLAGALARLTGAELIVAYALSPTLEFETSFAAQMASVFDKARNELPDSDFSMRELRGVSAPAGLADLAATEEAEAIVIGSTHRGLIGRTFPGSVGERLMSRAQCAVLVAPRGFANHEHVGVGLIGVAIDGGEEAKAALRLAAQLAERLGSRLRVITIVPPGEDETPVMEAMFRDRAKEIQEAARRELGPSLDVEFAAEEGHPPTCLARHGVDLDLLVIGSRGYGPVRRRALGGVSDEVIRTAPCPVLVVPRAALRSYGSSAAAA